MFYFLQCRLHSNTLASWGKALIFFLKCKKSIVTITVTFFFYIHLFILSNLKSVPAIVQDVALSPSLLSQLLLALNMKQVLENNNL